MEAFSQCILIPELFSWPQNVIDASGVPNLWGEIVWKMCSPSLLHMAWLHQRWETNGSIRPNDTDGHVTCLDEITQTLIRLLIIHPHSSLSQRRMDNTQIQQLELSKLSPWYFAQGLEEVWRDNIYKNWLTIRAFDTEFKLCWSQWSMRRWK